MIVALAAVRRGFSGSAQYWPTKLGEVLKLNQLNPPLNVTLIAEEHTEHYTARRLRIDRLQPRSDAGSGGSECEEPIGSATAPLPPSREVMQLHYTQWPNYGVPAATEGIISLLEATASHLGARPTPSALLTGGLGLHAAGARGNLPRSAPAPVEL